MFRAHIFVLNHRTSFSPAWKGSLNARQQRLQHKMTMQQQRQQQGSNHGPNKKKHHHHHHHHAPPRSVSPDTSTAIQQRHQHDTSSSSASSSQVAHHGKRPWLLVELRHGVFKRFPLPSSMLRMCCCSSKADGASAPTTARLCLGDLLLTRVGSSFQTGVLHGSNLRSGRFLLPLSFTHAPSSSSSSSSSDHQQQWKRNDSNNSNNNNNSLQLLSAHVFPRTDGEIIGIISPSTLGKAIAANSDKVHHDGVNDEGSSNNNNSNNNSRSASYELKGGEIDLVKHYSSPTLLSLSAPPATASEQMTATMAEDDNDDEKRADDAATAIVTSASFVAQNITSLLQVQTKIERHIAKMCEEELLKWEMRSVRVVGAAADIMLRFVNIFYMEATSATPLDAFKQHMSRLVGSLLTADNDDVVVRSVLLSGGSSYHHHHDDTSKKQDEAVEKRRDDISMLWRRLKEHRRRHQQSFSTEESAWVREELNNGRQRNNEQDDSSIFLWMTNCDPSLGPVQINKIIGTSQHQHHRQDDEQWPRQLAWPSLSPHRRDDNVEEKSGPCLSTSSFQLRHLLRCIAFKPGDFVVSSSFSSSGGNNDDERFVRQHEKQDFRNDRDYDDEGHDEATATKNKNKNKNKHKSHHHHRDQQEPPSPPQPPHRQQLLRMLRGVLGLRWVVDPTTSTRSLLRVVGAATTTESKKDYRRAADARTCELAALCAMACGEWSMALMALQQRNEEAAEAAAASAVDDATKTSSSRTLWRPREAVALRLLVSTAARITATAAAAPSSPQQLQQQIPVDENSYNIVMPRAVVRQFSDWERDAAANLVDPVEAVEFLREEVSGRNSEYTSTVPRRAAGSAETQQRGGDDDHDDLAQTKKQQGEDEASSSQLAAVVQQRRKENGGAADALVVSVGSGFGGLVDLNRRLVADAFGMWRTTDPRHDLKNLRSKMRDDPDEFKRIVGGATTSSSALSSDASLLARAVLAQYNAPYVAQYLPPMLMSSSSSSVAKTTSSSHLNSIREELEKMTAARRVVFECALSVASRAVIAQSSRNQIQNNLKNYGSDALSDRRLLLSRRWVWSIRQEYIANFHRELPRRALADWVRLCNARGMWADAMGVLVGAIHHRRRHGKPSSSSSSSRTVEEQEGKRNDDDLLLLPGDDEEEEEALVTLADRTLEQHAANTPAVQRMRRALAMLAMMKNSGEDRDDKMMGATSRDDGGNSARSHRTNQRLEHQMSRSLAALSILYSMDV